MVQVGIRTRNLFDPADSNPYPLSRSKLTLFLECPRCFYLDRRRGIGRPDEAYYSLNLAVDLLLKREFDSYRLKGEPHPAMKLYGIDAVPYRHKDLILWRDTPEGIRSVHSQSNFDVFGIIDDLWQHADGSVAIVDYKATSMPGPISLDGKDHYKRQLELYQWLLQRNGISVSPVGYLLYANASRDREAFERKLEFAFTVLPYEGSVSWVEDALNAAKECLMHETPPPSGAACSWCAYRRAARDVEV